MKIERRDSSTERAILIGLLTDKAVARGVSARVTKDTSLFASRWSNLLCRWAVEYYRKYGKPIGRNIERYFDGWAQKTKDEETIKLVEKFLSGLSTEYERKSKPSPDYVLDLAGQHFLKVQIRQLAAELEGDLEAGEVEKAAKKLTDYRKIEVGSTAGIDLFSDAQVIKAAFEAKSKPIIRFGQKATDLFFGHMLAREEFIALMGKAKVGKSFFLQELAFQAVRCKRKVAFFEVGDQSQHQLIRRFGARAAGIPIWVDGHPVKLPTEILSGGGTGPPTIEYDEQLFKHAITWEQARDGLKKFIGAKDRMRLSVHPNSSISVYKIETVLDDWAQDGFVPDAVLIDYADILAPMDGKLDSRDQINATWKGMRRINQKLHCCWITATQSDAASYETDLLRRKNFTDDRRKFDHVTGMIGINQTDKEKKEGIYRLNWLLGRDLDFPEDTCLHCAACLPLGNPMVRSVF